MNGKLFFVMIIYYVIYLIKGVSSIYFDFAKAQERCLVEELFSNSVCFKTIFFI